MPETDSPTDALDELKDRIELFLLGLRRPVLTEPGKEIIDLSESNYSLSTEYNKLLWHVWNDGTNLVRQVTGIHKEDARRMELRFQKFGKGPPGTLVVAESRAATEQLERRSGRARYSQALRRSLAQLFPQWKVESLSSEPDLKNSFSGCYTRGLISRGQRAWAVIGAGEQEDAHATENVLTYGIIWLDWLRRREAGRVFEGLKVFVPTERASTTQQRIGWLDSKVGQWEVYEMGDELRRCDPADVGNLRTSLAPAAGAFTLEAAGEGSDSHAINQQVKRIRALSPAIETHWGAGNYRVLGINGLSFAKEIAAGIVFGVGQVETVLDERNFGALRRLVEKILNARRVPSSDPHHPYFRLQPEKWMQSILVRQSGVLGYDLVPDMLYEQVHSLSGTERGLMDVLRIDSKGRLVVVEFKASEDIHLPLQALDYWMRVHWHQQRGELERQGYFPRRQISAQEPLLLLVSPALQFHPACETVLRYFSPTVEAIRVGINENWREEIQVLFRMAR